MYLDINTSRARKTFKRLLGQANHYLITKLVGLNYVKDDDIILPENFRTSWNPQNRISSSVRSREFAIKATLSFAIESFPTNTLAKQYVQNTKLYPNPTPANELITVDSNRIINRMIIFNATGLLLKLEEPKVKTARFKIDKGGLLYQNKVARQYGSQKNIN